MAWNLDADKPIYTQLVEIIQMQIISGQYKAGERLPSVRELAAKQVLIQTQCRKHSQNWNGTD